MKKNIFILGIIFAFMTVFTGCPGTPGGNDINPEIIDGTLTQKIAAAQNAIDFGGEEIAEDAVVSKMINIKNLKLGGKTLTIEASGTVLQNVSNAVIIVDKKVGNGDVTLTGCSNITKLVVEGGGSNSVHIKNSNVTNVEVKKEAVRVAMEGTSQVDAVVVNAANTKIESEETITIKAITVNEAIDEVTVKGGTVKKIEVVAFDEDGTPTNAPSETQGESQTPAKIIIDGDTEVQNISGTTNVTLTEEAMKKEEPIATFVNSTLVFLSNGSTTDPELENADYFYEYVFDLETDNIEMAIFKAKIYKLKDSIKLFFYTSQPHPDHPDIYSQQFLESDTNSLAFEDIYDTTMVLSSAGIVQGEFLVTIPDSPTASYYKSFDISNCGMPVRMALPEDPDKPLVTVKATEQGNKIHVSNSNRFYGSIEIFAAEKDENNKWKPSKTKLFTFDGYNYENPPAYTSLDFLDSYVNAGKEYAYYVDTSNYKETNKYEYSDTNLYHAVTAKGGKGEIVMQAEATTEGIKITVPVIETTDKYAFFDTLIRGDYQSNYTSINNLNKLKGEPVTDYFVNTGKQYTYTLDSHFYYYAEQYNYYPHSNICKITATGGLREAVITNSPAAVQNGQSVNFTPPPVLGISSIPDDFEIQISFSYSVQTGENSSSGKSFCIDYDYAPDATTVTGNLNSWFNQGPYGTYTSNKSYEVYIKYPYESDDPYDTTGITYHNFVHNTNFTGMPGTLTVSQE